MRLLTMAVAGRDDCGGDRPHVSLARHQDFAVQVECTANTKGSYTSLRSRAHNSPVLQYVHLVSIIHVDHVGITGISGPAAEPKRPLPGNETELASCRGTSSTVTTIPGPGLESDDGAAPHCWSSFIMLSQRCSLTPQGHNQQTSRILSTWQPACMHSCVADCIRVCRSPVWGSLKLDSELSDPPILSDNL